MFILATFLLIQIACIFVQIDILFKSGSIIFVIRVLIERDRSQDISSMLRALKQGDC